MRWLCPLDAPDAMDMWRHHHAGTDREETHPLHGDPLQTTSAPTEMSGETSSSGQEWRQAPREESVQARECISPPGLGEKQRGQKDPSSPLPYTDNCVLGHSHLTVTAHSHLPETLTNYPLPLSSGLCWFFSATSGASGRPVRAPGGL